MVRHRPYAALDLRECTSCEIKSQHLAFRRKLILCHAHRLTLLAQLWPDDIECLGLLH